MLLNNRTPIFLIRVVDLRLSSLSKREKFDEGIGLVQRKNSRKEYFCRRDGGVLKQRLGRSAGGQGGGLERG